MGPSDRGGKFSFYRCRATGKRAPVGGCRCIACSEMRHYRAQWRRDQAALRSPYYLRHQARERIRQSKEPVRAKNLARLKRWCAQQPTLARLMYDALRYLARRDGMWHERAAQ